MDPLSEVLSLLKPRSYISGGFDAGGKWAIQFPPHQGIKCYAVVAGQCWLAVEGVADPVRLKAGDCFLLSSGRPFRLASDLALTPVDARAVFSAAQGGCIASCNGGGDFFLVGGHFTLTAITPASCWEKCRPSPISAGKPTRRHCAGRWNGWDRSCASGGPAGC
ncbi:hypothetical protein BI344_20890 [Chromobacterium sphagni]|uniref:AraC-type transcription regulator ligand-binding domain-containing protein n=1 Tax=Chromobacterium sphagni TaxID=1903179 RepID=A0ABX3C8J0_9NEIS|nr:hypothetical protein BI344_20890 [Chromobacterium sphagni]